MNAGKTYHKLKETPLPAVRPEGILKEVLCAERDGMPGHLDEIGYPYSESCWGLKSLTDGGYQEWWPYEQTAYWLDAIIRLAILLKDKELLNKAGKQIKKALEMSPDGFIGPEELKRKGKRNQWPHAILFRALTALAEAPEEFSGFEPERLCQAMSAHYKTGTCDYTCFREVVNTESMLKLYELTGDEELFALAVKAYSGFNEEMPENDSSFPFLISDRKPNQHGVTYNEQAKLPAIFYLYTGDTKYLDASIKAYEKIDDYFMLPDGVHSSCEFTLGNDSLQAHETCDIADYTWSMGYLVMAAGDAKYADKIEKACFNAAFGAIGPYFKTIQYFSSVNQVIAARNSTHTVNFRDTPRFAYQPYHYPECCVGNSGRIFPNYAARMYMESEEGTALVLYGQSCYTGDGFTLTQEGRYPFEDTIRVTVSCKSPVTQALWFRLPGWCRRAVLKKNGKILFSQSGQNIGSEPAAKHGSDIPESALIIPENGFITAPGPLLNGDQFELTLPMEFAAHTSADGGRYFTYGPFLMTLKITQRWERDQEEARQTKAFPAYNVYPESSFSYCVAETYNGEGAEIRKGTETRLPWWDGAPFEIRIPAKKLPGFDITEAEVPAAQNTAANAETEAEEKVDETMVALGASKVVKKLSLTPPLPDKSFIEQNMGEDTVITLVPYGTAHARLTVFPAYPEHGRINTK